MMMKITISVLNYDTKSEAVRCQGENWKRLKKDGLVPALYYEKDVMPVELFSYLLQGYTVHTGLYVSKVKQNLRNDGTILKDNHYETPFLGSYLKRGFMSYAFWCGSQYMFVDIDGTKFGSIEDFVKAIRWKPTFAFYTPSDKPGCRRFKLVYCFSSIIDNPKYWVGISFFLHKDIKDYTGEDIKDKCGLVRTQPTYGHKGGTGVCDGPVYDPAIFDFIQFDQDVVNYVNSKFAPKPEITIDSYYTYAIGKAKDWKDLCTLVRPKKMPYRLESEVYWVEDYTVNEGYKWGLTKEDYWQLYTPNYKIQDKHKRRINLFLRTCLRRIIDPTLTPEDALICLYWDREKIIDNSDGVVDNKQLIKSVSKAFKLSDDELEQITQSEIEFLKANKKTPQIIYKAKPRKEWSKDNRKDKTKFTPLLKDPVDHPWQLGKLIYPKPLEHPDTMRKCFLMHIIDKCFDKSLSDSDNIDRINNIMAMNKFRLRVSSRQTIASYKAAYKIEKNKDRNSFIIQEYLKGSSSYQIKDEIDLHPEFNKVSARQIQRIIKEYNKNLSTSSSTTN